MAIQLHEAADYTPTVSQSLNMVYHSPADMYVVSLAVIFLSPDMEL